MNWSPFRSALFEEFPSWTTQWRGVGDLQERVNQLFSAYSENGRDFPSANVFVDGDKVTITMEVPGVSSENLDVNVVGRRLSVSGKRLLPEQKEGERFIRRERGVGEFSRTLELPFPIDNNAIEATHKRGVLSIIATRAEADKPRRIEVK